MSIRRWAGRRDLNETAIVAALQDIGCQVYRLSQPCDLLVKFRGKLHLLEVDNPQSKHRKREDNQLLFLRQWEVPLVQTPNDAFRAIGAQVTTYYPEKHEIPHPDRRPRARHV